MNSIKEYYAKMGFKIVKLRAEQKLEPAQAALTNMKIDLNTSVSNEHIPEIECLNRTMKKRIWSVYTKLVWFYIRVPGVLVRKLVFL